MSFCNIVLLGNLGRDPVLVFQDDGTARADFTMAVNDGKDSVTWYHIWVRGKQAEVAAEYLKKGAQVLVSGRRVTASYYIDKDGDVRTTLDVNASRWVFADSKADRERQETEEIPF